MSIWSNATITNKGNALQGKLLSTDKINITRVVSASGKVVAGQLVNQTNVTDIKQTLTLEALSYNKDGAAVIKVSLNNNGLSESYNCNQIGIFASDPDEGEILYAVAQANEAEPVPSISEQPAGFYCGWVFTIGFGSTAGISVTIDPANALTVEAGDMRYLQNEDVIIRKFVEYPESEPCDVINGSLTIGKRLHFATNGTIGTNSFASGQSQVADGKYSFAGGGQTNRAKGESSSVVGGYANAAEGKRSFIGGGTRNTANGEYSSVSGGEENAVYEKSSFVGGGSFNKIYRQTSFIGGGRSNNIGSESSDGEGNQDSFIGGGSVNKLEGSDSFMGGGNYNQINGNKSFVGGGQENVCNSDRSFIGGGYGNQVDNSYTFVGGGRSNHSEGYYSFIGGGIDNYSKLNYTFVAGGKNNQAIGDAGFATGLYNIANARQAVFGRYADTSSTVTKGGVSSDTTSVGSLFVIGNGTAEDARGNAFRVAAGGAIYAGTASNATGADKAKLREWLDGNPDGEDRRGFFVTLDGEKIRKATAADDYIFGVVSAPDIASFIDNTASESWNGKFMKDVFGSYIYEDKVIPAYTDENGEEHPEETVSVRVLNPEWKPEQEYIPREERQEWAVVCEMGDIVIRDDGTCQVNGYCKPNDMGIGTASDTRTPFRVMKRKDESHVLIYKSF